MNKVQEFTLPPLAERPLVTFALFAYNQERFVRESVEGALAQTYSPLQMILSDDCSTDRTFEIMQHIVADYAGPHEIILNRNERNLGLGAHVNRVMELAKGEFILAAAGDDISIPERTMNIIKYWYDIGRKECSIYSAYHIMDVDGQIIARNNQHPLPKYANNIVRMLEQECPGVHGATHAWHKSFFEKFGPLPNEIITEDRAIAVRAVLCDGIYYLSEPLVLYRKLPESVGRTMMRDRNYYTKLHGALLLSTLEDCRKAGWQECDLKKLSARFVTNYEFGWKMKNEKAIVIPWLLASLAKRNMRLSTGFELLLAHFPSFYRYAYNGLKKTLLFE